MIGNYLINSYRNLWRNRLHTILNILGLATGVTCFILILLFVKYELSYDRFNANADRIYRIAVNGMLGNTEIHQTGTPPPLPAAMYQEFPEVESVTRVMKYSNLQGTYEQKVFIEDNIFLADSSFLDIFSVQLTGGNKAYALNQPGVMLITEKTAKKYFGGEDPINKTIIFKNDHTEFNIRVSGVMKDLPANAHFHPDFLISFLTFKDLYDNKNWFHNPAATYLMVKPNTNAKVLENKFPAFIAKYFFQGGSYADFVKSGNYWRYSLQPLTRIHLISKLNGEFEANGNSSYVYILTLAAIFVLVIACINYMNLYTAKSFNRAKEIGVRKSFGSTRLSLIKQLLLESIVLSFLSVGLAVILVDSLLPFYRNFTDKPLEFHYFNPATLLQLAALVLIVGVFSGSYPALYLSSFRPAVILQQKSGNNRKNINFRNLLVILQFTISICLIAGTIMVYKQLQYMRYENLGINKENVVVVKNIAGLGSNKNAFILKLSSNPHIQRVSMTSDIFGSDFVNWGYGAEGKQTFTLNTFYCDTAYAEVLKLKMASGRFFSSQYSSDSSAIVINEAAVKMLDWKEPLNKQVNLYTISKNLRIIGIMKDFNYESKQTEIRPMAIILLNGVAKNDENTSANFILARLNPGNPVESIDFIKNSWNQLSNGVSFNYSFLDEEYDNLYRNEAKSQQLFLLFAILSIFIACLGLFGLASYLAVQRTREVGLRKVNGATRANILLLLSENYIKWISVAFIIACPICWIILHKWLMNFAYHAELGLWIFGLAGIIALVIALLTISWQSWRAATRNPVEALRYE
jgi:putative ABC transport system permease protein